MGPVQKAVGWRRTLLALILFLLAAPILALLSVPAVFDLSESAPIYDEEYRLDNGIRVSAGPRPRWFLCYPPYHDFFYEGTEWPFRVYSPLCRLWRTLHGYDAPSRTGSSDH